MQVATDRLYMTGIDEATHGCLKRLWGDSGVQMCYTLRSRFQIADSAK
jgi:hypothetical protein